VKKKNKKNKKTIGICVGGPAAGELFQVIGSRQIMPTPTDPIYACAVYILTNRKTLLNEIIALFEGCIKRQNLEEKFAIRQHRCRDNRT